MDEGKIPTCSNLALVLNPFFEKRPWLSKVKLFLIKKSADQKSALCISFLFLWSEFFQRNIC